MHLRACVTVILSAALSTQAVAAPESLLVNGGFETAVQVTMGEFHAWDVLSRDARKPAHSPTPYAGGKSLLLEAGSPRYSLWQRVPQPPAAKAIVLRAMVKAEDVRFGPDGHATIEAQVNYDHVLKSHFYLRLEPGTYDWREAKFVGTPIQGLTITSIDLRIDGQLEAGRLHIDDVSLTPDDALATPAAMLGRKVEDLATNLARIGPLDPSVARAQTLLKEAMAVIQASPDDLTKAQDLWQQGVAAVSKPAFAKMFPEAVPKAATEARIIYHGTGVTKEETDGYLKKIEDGGFNAALLSLGTWDGVLYDSEFTRRLPEWESFDSLPYFIAEAKKRGVRSFGYIAAFYGLKAKASDPGHVMNRHPEWFAQNPHDPSMATFPDPANPEAVEFIANLYVELVQKFDVAGVGLDYIRYPEIYSLNYDERNRQAIEQRYGFDILAADPAKNPDQWRKIQEYRAEQIDRAIGTIRERIHAVKPGMPVVASLISEVDLSAKGVGQDWFKSSRYIDYSSPMNYDDVSLYEDLLKTQRDAFAKNQSLFIPAIGGMPRVQDSWTLSEWAHRIAVQRKIGCDGIAVYRVAELDPAVAIFLGKGPFRNDAAFPPSRLATPAFQKGASR